MAEKKIKRVVITGGHLTPALAVIKELRKREDWSIVFIGRQYAAEGEKVPSAESEIIPPLEIPFYPIQAGRIQRRFTRWTIPALLRVPLGFFHSLLILTQVKPRVVLSFGGYLSVPVVLAAWFLGIPIITHEQTAVQGLATKFNVPFARKVAVSWPKSVEQFPAQKVVLTGNPIREEILRFSNKIWQLLKFDKNLPLIFITGGGQGSHSINLVIEKSLLQLLKIANVFHQTGYLEAFGDFERLEKKRGRLSPLLKKRYHLKKYLTGLEFGTILNKADLVVCRAGANTTTELATLGKPAIMIPLPWGGRNEQLKNAQLLVRAGTAEILLQDQLSVSSLIVLVEKMLANQSGYRKNAPQAKALVKADAAVKIVDLLETLVK